MEARKQLTNISSGHYASNFRPHSTLHKKLSGFDFQNSFYYYNIGENETRCWNDYRAFGFISGGGDLPRWRDAMLSFEEGDIVAAYLKGKGFVGIGRVLSSAKPVREVLLDNKPLLSHPLEQPNLGMNCDNYEVCEYVCLVDWIGSVNAENAKWKSKDNLFTSQLVRASMDNQPHTVSFLEDNFNLSIKELLI